MNITVFYVGTSLLSPLKNAERDINNGYALDLRVSAYNFGSPLPDSEWTTIERDVSTADVVFVIHVIDGENGSRLLVALERFRERHHAVIVINCMPDLMRQTKIGKLDFRASKTTEVTAGHGTESRKRNSRRAVQMVATIGWWVGKQARRGGHSDNHGQYLKLIERLPGFLRFVPAAGKLRDVKNYLFLFCCFLQPTPANIRAMLLFALQQYVPDKRLKKIRFALPESVPPVAIYHPDAPKLFESFAKYEAWYRRRNADTKQQTRGSAKQILDPESTVGLLLMRPHVVSKTTQHYDTLIRSIEREGLSVIPALSTLMDNREACGKFFIAHENGQRKQSGTANKAEPRVSQVVSLTGFSFVGGPAMNDSDAAERFLLDLNRPYRSAVSLDMQTIESWRDSQTGLNPVQSGMQVAIPEIDGATEPFVYGGIPGRGIQPVAIDERCRRFARRLKRWNRLRTAARGDLKLALTLFCFPPNKGNIGTAADLDVFPSLWDTLSRLESEGYTVVVPPSPEALRDDLLHGNSERFGSAVNVIYRMGVDEYRRLCPYARDAEAEWGAAPGRINTFGGDLLIQGVMLGNVFVGVQPTFGYEGDPMRLMMAKGGAPHHGFLAFYTYLEKVFGADAVIHVGTHGSLEFMPGKQVGLSEACWPDRLIGELPNIYLYSVNNPSEGSIAKRRSYGELISYLTPPIENAGLYKDFATLKELVLAYRQTQVPDERARLFASIEEYSEKLNLEMPDNRRAAFVN